MTKTRTSRFISMFLCVCMAVLCIQGLSFRAAADEVYEEFATVSDDVVTGNIGVIDVSAGEHFKILSTLSDDGIYYCDPDGLWVSPDETVTVTSLNGEIITKIEAHIGYMQNDALPAVSSGTISGYTYVEYGSCDITVNDINASSVTFSEQTGYDDGDYTSMYEISSWKIYYVEGSHTHNYVYSAEGDTISITCDADGCTEPPYTASMTLVAPTLTTEGGEGSPEATILMSGIDDEFVSFCEYQTMEEFVLAGQNAIVYYNGDEELAEAPTEAGDYTAELSFYDDDVGEYIAAISYTIAEATPEPEPAPSAPIAVTGTAKAASGGAPGLVSGTSGSFEMLTWNAQLSGKTLTWEAKDGADGYVISIRAKGAKAFKRFDRVTEKSADLSKLKAGTYTIYVRYEKDGKLAKCRQSARTTIKIG